MSFRCCRNEIVSLAAGVTYGYTFNRFFLPFLEIAGVRYWAGGLLPFFYIYAKCLVKKVVAKTSIQPYGVSDANAVSFNMTEVATVVVPWEQAGNYAGVALYDSLKTIPTTHLYNLGTQNGGHDLALDLRTIDVEKYLGQELTTDHALVKTNANVISLPNGEQAASLPTQLICFQLPSAVPAAQTYRYVIRYDWVYHVEFSDIRELPVNFGQIDEVYTAQDRA